MNRDAIHSVRRADVHRDRGRTRGRSCTPAAASASSPAEREAPGGALALVSLLAHEAVVRPEVDPPDQLDSAIPPHEAAGGREAAGEASGGMEERLGSSDGREAVCVSALAWHGARARDGREMGETQPRYRRETGERREGCEVGRPFAGRGHAARAA